MAFFLDEIDSCLWDYLRQTEKKIVLYGMGDGAEKIKSVLDEAGVPVRAGTQFPRIPRKEAL